MTPAQRVKLIEDRMMEIGKPSFLASRPIYGGGCKTVTFVREKWNN